MVSWVVHADFPRDLVSRILVAYFLNLAQHKHCHCQMGSPTRVGHYNGYLKDQKPHP